MAASQLRVWISARGFNLRKAPCVRKRFLWRISEDCMFGCRSISVPGRRGSVFDVSSPKLKRLSAVNGAGSYSNGLQDFEKQLEELFSIIKTMIKLGRKEDAIELLEANHEAVKEQTAEGSKGIEQAALLDIVALGYMAVGDLEKVENILEMLSEVIGCIANETPLRDSILIHMGGLYANLGKLDLASHAYARSLNILEDAFGSQSPFVVVPLLGLAKVLKLRGRVTEAMEAYQRSIAVLEKSRGSMSEDLVLPLSCIGNLYIDDGRATDAKATFSRILSIYTRSYGEDDGRVGMAMCSLAHANCAEGNIEEAVRLYKKGLEVISDSKFMSIDDDVLEKMKIDLADLLHTAGRETEGRELLEECLLINERYKGSEDPSTAAHLVNLAASYTRSKNFVEAERLLQTTLSLMSRTLGARDQSLSVPMLHLAVVLYYLRRDEEAENLALEALSLRESAFGRESLPVGEALDVLVSIQARLGKDDGEALENLKRVLAIQEAEFGVENEEVMETLKKMIFFLDRMGKRVEKAPIQRRLTALNNKFKYLVPS
ncbi:tetratricopeptide repeat (TPR)-like superfamily protein isoform X2 [Wolffia australiana]